MVKPYSLVAGQLVSCGQKRESPAEFGKLYEDAARDQKYGRQENVTHGSRGSADVESKCRRRLNAAPDLIPLRELNSRPSATAPADYDVTVQQTADPEVPASRPLPLPDLISHLSAKEVTPSRRRKKFRLTFPQVKKTFYYCIVNYRSGGIFAFYSNLCLFQAPIGLEKNQSEEECNIRGGRLMQPANVAVANRLMEDEKHARIIRGNSHFRAQFSEATATAVSRNSWAEKDDVERRKIRGAAHFTVMQLSPIRILAGIVIFVCAKEIYSWTK
jgi:hypothetical protein